MGIPKGECLDPFQDLELFSEVEYLGRHACSISQQQWVQNQYIDHALTNDSELLVTSGIQAVGELWAHHPSRKSSLPHQCAPDLTTDSAVIIVRPKWTFTTDSIRLLKMDLTLTSMSTLDSDVLVGRRHGVLPPEIEMSLKRGLFTRGLGARCGTTPQMSAVGSRWEQRQFHNLLFHRHPAYFP